MSRPTSSARSVRARRGSASQALGLAIAGVILLVLGYALGRRQGESSEPSAAASSTVVEHDGARTGPGDADPSVPVASGAGADTGAPPAPTQPALADHASPLEFDPPILDFGLVGPDAEMREVVHVTNVSNQPVHIVDMRPDCKCTTVEDLSGQVLEPGASASFTTLVQGRPYPGAQSNEVRFLLEGHAGLIRYHMMSEVSRAVRTEPAHFTTLDHVSGIVLVESILDRPFRILSAGDEPPVYADDFDPKIDEPRARYRLAWDLSGYDPSTCKNEAGERMPFYWQIQTDDPDAPVLEVRVRSLECTLPEPSAGRPWVLNLQRAVLGALKPGESAEFTTYLKWRGDAAPSDTIRTVMSESPDFEAELLSAEHDGERINCRVRITPHAGFVGEIYGSVRFIAYRSGSQQIHILGRVDPG